LQAILALQQPLDASTHQAPPVISVAYDQADLAATNAALSRLMADFVLSDASVAARLTVHTLWLLSLGGGTAQTGTHKLLAGIAGHAASLRIAVLHALLLRGELRAGGRRKGD